MKKINLKEMDWRTYDMASQKAEELSQSPNVGKYEAIRRLNQAKAFREKANSECDKQYGIDKIKEKERLLKQEKPYAEYTYTNGDLKRMQRQADDVHNFYTDRQEYKDGKWKNKNESIMRKKAIRLTEGELYNIIENSIKKIMVESFQNNQGYSHFAVNKATNKIVNGWDYAEYDPSELRQFKKDYFDVDLIDNDLDPKQYKIVTSKYLIRQGINPDDNNNWANS